MWLNSLRSTNEVSWSHAEQLITNQLINIYADVAQFTKINERSELVACRAADYKSADKYIRRCGSIGRAADL